jgi:aryl-alcohol dehydrogenase-like predicted oxidoreductase
MAELPTKTLGRTGLQVTALGYGAMELRGAPRGREIAPETAQSVLNAVLDGGVTFIDTSIDYGQSEELIGRFIAGRRSEYVLATKCGCLVGAAPAPPGERNPHIFTRENIVAGVNQSLARMKVDYIDVLQFHASPSMETLEENGAIQTVQDLKKEGKIRFIGMSGTLPNIEGHIASGVFDAFQIPYSALQREHEEVICRAAQAGAGIIIRGGVARGGPAEDKQQADALALWEKAGLDELLDGMTRMEFMLRFTLSHPDLHTTIVGTINPKHLQDNLNAAQKGPLPADVYDEALRRLTVAGSVPVGT